MAVDVGPLESAAARLITMLGESPDDAAVDAWVDPKGGAQLLGSLGEKRATVLVRVFPRLGDGEAGSGPTPAPPMWMVVTKGSAEIRMNGAEGGSPVETRRATRVVVESASLPDGGEGAVSRVHIHLDRKASANGALLVAEAWATSEEAAVNRVRKVAAQLSRALSVPASLPAATPNGASGGAEDEGNEGRATNVSAMALSRYTWRGEGPRLVLRDFGSRGPRERAMANFLVGTAFVGLAAGGWEMFRRALPVYGLGSAQALAWLGGAVLLTLAAVAFLGIAQFARKYKASSLPLLAVGDGKLNVMPWVNRKGAVMLEPEGRFGAAIDLGEVRGVSVQGREGQHAVEIATDHGPFDALLTGDKALADLLAAAVERAITDLSPQAKPNAKQRARARAAGSSEPAPA